MKRLSIISGLVFLTVLLSSTSAFAVSSSQKIIVEIGLNNAYTLISNKGVRMQHVPADYQAKLTQLVNRNVAVSDVEFTPDGNGWSIITANSHQTHNITGDYSKTLNQLQQSGKKINAVAFNPLGWENQQGFVIVHDKGYKANNVPSTLTVKLDEFLAQGAELKSVEFTPNGGWSIITNISTWGNMKENPSVKVSYLDYISSLFIANDHVFASAFNPNNYETDMGWLVIEDDQYIGQFIPENLSKALNAIGLKASQVKSDDMSR